jgi:Cu-Zn family superoxide dismutase
MGIRGTVALAAAPVLGACAHQGEKAEEAKAVGTTAIEQAAGKPAAVAKIEARSGSQVGGTAEFIPLPDGKTRVVLNLTGLTPGPHGVHLHQVGDCSAPDATSAGPHWNPMNQPHGGPGAPEHHAGDLGNAIAGDDGKTMLVLESADFTVGGENSVLGKAIVVHASPDDLTSQPAGNSGARVGCGVIAKP